MTKQKGQSLVELLIALGIFVTIISVVVFLLIDGYLSSLQSGQNSLAIVLAEEGLEATRSIRDNNWGDLTAGSHGLQLSQSHWIFSGNQEDISSKLKEGIREVIVENIDSNRKKITSKISWTANQGRQNEINLKTFLTNWQKHAE